MPRLIANNITIPREVQNDCDPGDPRRLQRDSTLVLRHHRPAILHLRPTRRRLDRDASTSVYQNSYTKQCHAERATQVAFLEQTFAASKAEWKFLQLHHGSPSSRNTAASSSKTATTTVSRTSTIITRTLFSPAARGIPRLGTVTTGCRWAPYTKWLGANSQSAANGFVTMDISREEVNVEYYAWDMKFGGGDLYPIKNDMTPSYSFKIKSHAW
ncbi:hypothetical protein CNMCM6069_005717 [Aspergillus lentulus]|nr:hypothetical protein CNMCM6069_005717 [Aspergillus lentulus]